MIDIIESLLAWMMSGSQPARNRCNRLLRTAAIYSLPVSLGVGVFWIPNPVLREWMIRLISLAGGFIHVCAWLSLENWRKRLPLSLMYVWMGMYVCLVYFAGWIPTLEGSLVVWAGYLLCAVWSLCLEIRIQYSPATEEARNAVAIMLRREGLHLRKN